MQLNKSSGKSMAQFLKPRPNTILSSSSSSSDPQTLNPESQIQKPKKKRRKIEFPSYLDTPHISHRARLLCELIANPPPSDIESSLSATGITPYSDVVQEVLKLSYSHPESALKFFRWSGLNRKPTADAWNLVVDLLGRNQMFDQMWDAIRSMKKQDLLSKAAFVSAIESYCDAERINEAFMTFDAMENFGVEPDVAMVNSLLRAVVSSGDQIDKALDFFDRMKPKIRPDSDTFAVVFEGLERTNDVAKAKTTFGEMVVRLGWDAKNMPAYDAFLTTLVRGGHIEESIKFLQTMKKKNCLPGLRFLSSAIGELLKQNDSVNAIELWDMMVVNGSLVPDLILNNSMISLLCSSSDLSNAFRFLDEMSFYGAFPDSHTYNMVFECLVNSKKAPEAGRFFVEMLKNECPPTPSICVKAIKMFFGQDDPEMAVEIWNYMLENRVMPIDESANALLIGLCELGRFSELKRSAFEMMDRRIEIYESTMGRVKSHCVKDGLPRGMYDGLHRRWKAARSL